MGQPPTKCSYERVTCKFSFLISFSDAVQRRASKDYAVINKNVSANIFCPMTSSVDIQESGDSLVIVIKPQPKGILIFGTWFFYTIPVVMIFGLFFYVFGRERSSSVFEIQFIWMVLLSIGAGLLTMLSFRKIYEREIITVTGKSLALTKVFLFRRTAQEFRKEEITDLKVLGRQNFSKHPLDTSGFDYLGVGTAEKEVQFLIEDGRIGFQHNGSTVRFGKHVWEEDGIEIIDRINKYWR